MRRALPAISTRSQAGWSRSAAASASAIASAFDRSSRGFGRPSAPAASAASMLSSAFAPKPRRPRICSASAAFLSASSESIASSSNSLRAFFGPSPGMRVTSTRPGGNLALSLSADGIVPVSSSAPIFSSIVLPTPAQLGHARRRGHLLDRRVRLADRLGRVAVGDAPDGRSRRRARTGQRARRSGGRSRRSSSPGYLTPPCPGPGWCCRPTTKPRTSSASCAPRCRSSPAPASTGS